MTEVASTMLLYFLPTEVKFHRESKYLMSFQSERPRPFSNFSDVVCTRYQILPLVSFKNFLNNHKLISVH